MLLTTWNEEFVSSRESSWSTGRSPRNTVNSFRFRSYYLKAERLFFSQYHWLYKRNNIYPPLGACCCVSRFGSAVPEQNLLCTTRDRLPHFSVCYPSFKSFFLVYLKCSGIFRNLIRSKWSSIINRHLFEVSFSSHPLLTSKSPLLFTTTYRIYHVLESTTRSRDWLAINN